MQSRTLVAALASTFLIAGPALAAQSSTASPNAIQQNPSDHASKASAQKIVDHATKAVDQLKSDQQLDHLLSRAKGVFILPNFVKGAAIVGGEGGQGVLLARTATGWSDPAFLSLASGSVGAQIGGEAGPMVMLLMTQKAVDQFTQNGNFSLNANAGLTIVNYSARGQSNVGKGDIVVWSGTSGGFVGANVSGTGISVNQDENRAYYGKPVTVREIIQGQVMNAEADGLRNALPA